MSDIDKCHEDKQNRVSGQRDALSGKMVTKSH